MLSNCWKPQKPGAGAPRCRGGPAPSGHGSGQSKPNVGERDDRFGPRPLCAALEHDPKLEPARRNGERAAQFASRIPPPPPESSGEEGEDQDGSSDSTETPSGDPSDGSPTSEKMNPGEGESDEQSPDASPQDSPSTTESSSQSSSSTTESLPQTKHAACCKKFEIEQKNARKN